MSIKPARGKTLHIVIEKQMEQARKMLYIYQIKEKRKK